MEKMETKEVTIRHLLDLCRKSERTGSWQYSAFLSPAEQDDWLGSREAAGCRYFFTGGHECAERRILVAGDETEAGPPELPLSVIAVRPKNGKYAEKLTHRDYLGAILGLGIERALIGDILVREQQAWFFCLAPAADMIASGLTQVRRTAVVAQAADTKVPELQPKYETVRMTVASERADAVVAGFAAVSRAEADKLFAAGKVFVNSRAVSDRSFRLKEGDILSVRGIGRVIYDGIDHETKKNRYHVRLRKPV